MITYDFKIYAQKYHQMQEQPNLITLTECFILNTAISKTVNGEKNMLQKQRL